MHKKVDIITSNSNYYQRGSLVDNLIDFNVYPIRAMLSLLLSDKTTRKSIIWATDTYSCLGDGYRDTDYIEAKAIAGVNSGLIRPRVSKAQEEQQERTRKKAEVFTPSWLCCRMINFECEEWFGRKDVFNTMDGNEWKPTDDRIEFPEGKTWQEFVDARCLEITCGEAPFLVSRYDTVTGELIVPPKRRIGLLDRKLRIVDENTESKEEWDKWAIRAFQSCYGYEYQGDNVVLARVNLLMTFCDYYQDRWQEEPEMDIVKKVANIIAWNIWQMDGLKDTVPIGAPYEESSQLSLFDEEGNDLKPMAPLCRIYDWRANCSQTFRSLKGENV